MMRIKTYECLSLQPNQEVYIVLECPSPWWCHRNVKDSEGHGFVENYEKEDISTQEQHLQVEQQKKAPLQENPQLLPVYHWYHHHLHDQKFWYRIQISESSFFALGTWTEAACAGVDTLRSPKVTDYD